jgi:Rrf2 family cysteine metabolism transcriptional repressor
VKEVIKVKISTRGRYALEAVLDLAFHASSGHESLKNIAERSGISANYLEQIFMRLKRNGIIESMRGAQGGYRLARDAREITAGEVIRAAEGQFAPTACVAEGSEKRQCQRYEMCVTRLLWARIMDGMNVVSDSLSISDLVEMCRNNY